MDLNKDQKAPRTDTTPPPSPKRLVLPSIIASPSDVRRALRDLEDIENFLQQAKIRQAGTNVTLPRTRHSLDEFATRNELNWLQAADRDHAKRFLNAVLEHAPAVHVSFATDPSIHAVDKVEIGRAHV